MTEQEQSAPEISDRLRGILERGSLRPNVEQELEVARNELSAALAREHQAVRIGQELASYARELEQQQAALQQAMANDRRAWEEEIETVRGLLRQSEGDVLEMNDRYAAAEDARQQAVNECERLRGSLDRATKDAVYATGSVQETARDGVRAG